MSTLDNLRREAKRWLKALRAKDPSARERWRRAYPAASDDPTLRDVQHALARELGEESWTSLKASVAKRAEEARTAGSTSHDAELGARLIEFACWDHHTHGIQSYRSNQCSAMRLLSRRPDLARQSFFTAIVCGDLDHVRSVLEREPDLAVRQGGPRGWTPLLYLCFARLPVPALDETAVAIARELLDRGADPNAHYMAGSSRYTALVGVAGEGEQDAPRDQPFKEDLYRLLLERGAGPYDIQVLYNTHFSGEMLWWLKLTYAHDEQRGALDAWRDPEWSMFGMGGHGPGSYFVLRAAIEKNNLELARWALARGADPNVTSSTHPKFKPRHSLHQEAVLRGRMELASLLASHGADTTPAVLQGEEQLIAAVLRLDRPAVDSYLREHPEARTSPAALFAAAQLDRADAVAMLLDAGVPIEVEDDSGQRALHVAAGHNAIHVARLLIERGAEIDPRERQWHSTPLGFASYGDHREMIELLVAVSRNVWSLASLGAIDRLREVLREEPERAREVSPNGATPLMWLPDDEQKAEAVVELLAQHGADPSARTKPEGLTATELARRRGLDGAARRLAAAAGTPWSDLPAEVSAPTPALDKYERLARDLAVAFETGEPSSMQRLMEHYGRRVTWEELREGVRHRLTTLPAADVPNGYFALPHARLIVAREAGFANWSELAEALSSTSSSGQTTFTSYTPTIAPGMIMPVEVAADLPVRMRDGSQTSTQEIWSMLNACRDGDLQQVTGLLAKTPALLLCDYNYMTPLHLAVREGHYEIVRLLAERGAANSNYVTYPYRESLITLARDRGYDGIVELLESWYAREDKTRPDEEGGAIDAGRDEDRIRFERLVTQDALPEVERMVRARPELALDPFAAWFEGILAMPANRGNRRMIELLMEYGARVPQVTKWGPEYYFKRFEIAEFFIERGMNPNHMNVHHTTLLHEMAFRGDMRKATLLLDAGADIDAVDEEFRSTPLGLAARFDNRAIVELLLSRGADPNRAGAAWATPLEWARKKGHADIAERLRRAGAHDGRPKSRPADRPKRETDVMARVGVALDTHDAALLRQLMREHREVFEQHWPYWLELEPETIVARARPPRWLPVRPEMEHIQVEVEAAGGDEAARLEVARSYGADSWERLVLACQLIDAIWRDDAERVRAIIESYPYLLHEDAGIRHSNWGPPMAYAANLGRNRIVRMLHDMGAEDIQWALDRAVLQGQADTARMLYELGARADAAMLEGPAETLNPRGMELLLDLGVTLTPENAPVAMVLQGYGRNPSGKHQILEMFVRHGITLPDTAPMAVHRGRIDRLESHLRRDPNLFSRTFAHEAIFPPELGCHADHSLALHGTPLDGAGLLHMCVEYGEIEIIRGMLERKADVNLRARVDADGFGGHTPLFGCVVSMYGGHRRTADIAALLLDHGADPHVRASLRKGVRFSDDESVHEYRNVTPAEWGERFHDRSLVNEPALQLLIERVRART